MSIILQKQKKHNKTISKVISIISKLVLDQYHPIIRARFLKMSKSHYKNVFNIAP